MHAMTHIHTLARQLLQRIGDGGHFDAAKIRNQSVVRLWRTCSANRLRPQNSCSAQTGANKADDQQGYCDRVGFHEAAKLVHFLLLDVYMWADSNTVFRQVEEPIHLLQRGIKR